MHKGNDAWCNITLIPLGLSAIKGIKVTSLQNSPVIHVRLAKSHNDRLKEEEPLQKIVDEVGSHCWCC